MNRIISGAAALALSAAPGAHAKEDTVRQSNVETITAYVDAINRHDVDAAAAFWSPDARNFGRPADPARIRLVLEDIVTRAPDVRLDVETIVAVGDDVVFRARYSGTHRGVGRLPVDGGQLVGVAPTGKTFSVLHIHWFTLAGGKIVEHWGARDDVGMLVQLGLLPPPPPFPTTP